MEEGPFDARQKEAALGENCSTLRQKLGRISCPMSFTIVRPLIELRVVARGLFKDSTIVIKGDPSDDI